jgi:hypothetical protein
LNRRELAREIAETPGITLIAQPDSDFPTARLFAMKSAEGAL